MGQRLRAWRTQRLLTQKELAAKAGLRWQTVSEIETGHHRPRLSTVRVLAAALEVEPSALIGPPPES